MLAGEGGGEAFRGGVEGGAGLRLEGILDAGRTEEFGGNGGRGAEGPAERLFALAVLEADGGLVRLGGVEVSAWGVGERQDRIQFERFEAHFLAVDREVDRGGLDGRLDVGEADDDGRDRVGGDLSGSGGRVEEGRADGAGDAGDVVVEAGIQF